MSALLESCLDVARRCECEANDAALLSEPYMKHKATSAARVFSSLPSEDASDTEYRITVMRHGQPDESYTARFASSFEANMHAVEKAGDGARVVVTEAGDAFADRDQQALQLQIQANRRDAHAMGCY